MLNLTDMKIMNVYINMSFFKTGCTDTHFACKDGKCVDIDARCDREYDCDDESDEWECGKFQIPEQLPYFFTVEK